jgi:hypothetical protein
MDLLIASNISGSWQRYTVDNGNGVGYHSAMDVDSNDVLHIVYKTNAAGNTVKYATGLSGSAWTDSNQGTQEVHSACPLTNMISFISQNTMATQTLATA